ncbi:MAG TPA: ATP-binding cassette domain-containing protein [Burkholderiaceae bacterium]
MSEPVIRISKLTTAYGATVVHENLDLEVRQGEVMAIVGGSGAGKTTLLRQMLGLEQPATGVVEIFGKDVHRAASRQLRLLRNRWGMLFQHGALFSALNAFDNVAQPLRELRVLPYDLIRDTVHLKLRMVGLTPQDGLKMPADLSGGMVKRVALARALALEPELLFLDEPTAGLDPCRSESFVELIQALRRELNLTAVMVTHDLDTLFELADRIAVLADRRFVALGTAAEVVEVQHPFIAEFFLGERGRRAMQALHNKKEIHGK